jgi:hypothetical protein
MFGTVYEYVKLDSESLKSYRGKAETCPIIYLGQDPDPGKLLDR